MLKRPLIYQLQVSSKYHFSPYRSLKAFVNILQSTCRVYSFNPQNPVTSKSEIYRSIDFVCFCYTSLPNINIVTGLYCHILIQRGFTLYDKHKTNLRSCSPYIVVFLVIVNGVLRIWSRCMFTSIAFNTCFHNFMMLGGVLSTESGQNHIEWHVSRSKRDTRYSIWY